MTDFFNDAWTSFLAYFDAEGGILATIFQIVVVLVLAWLIIRTVDKGTRRWVKQFEALPAIHPRRQRAFTTSSLLTSSVRYIVWPIALIMVLSELNIDVAAMIATAGIAGLAIGFGAQTFVKDVISGIFLLFDDTIHVGDMVKIGSEEGTVEFIGIRLIKVRKFNGEMLMVPAGELRIFGNLSIGYARVIVDVGLSYEQDLETILPVLERIAHTWADSQPCELNIDVAAMIATAGIAGLAIGFGAQTFVKDVISGIFLLFDDTIHVGDMVKIGSEEGTVEFIGIRLIKVRKFNGEMLMVPAGELRIFGNLSIGYARVIVDVGLSYEQDLETILPVLERIAHTWAEAHREILLEEEPQVQAVTHFADSSINARIVVQVQPGEQFEAERALRRMLKQEFDRQGIEIPFPRRTVYMREEKQAGSPPDTNE